MRKIIYTLAVLLSASFMLSSCLKSNDDDDVTLYDDMAITSFTLGTLNRYTTITSSSTGNDSTIKTTVSGSLYAMSIDHVGGKIYNQNPLPNGTDTKHVLCTIGTRNNGIVLLKALEPDTTLTYHSATDSVNLSQPRIFRVYATDGSGFREYTVTLNVDEETGSSFEWMQRGTTADTADFANRQLRAAGDTITMTTREAEPDWANVQKDEADELLPAAGSTVMVSWDYAPVKDARYTLAVGLPQQSDVNDMRLWRKISEPGNEGQWVFMPWDDANRYRLPRSTWYTLAYTDDRVLAIGSNMRVLESRDQGITWKKSTTYSLSTALTGTQVLLTTDDTGRLWLVTNTGQVWKGVLK